MTHKLKLQMGAGQQMISSAEFLFMFGRIDRATFDARIAEGNRLILNALDGIEESPVVPEESCEEAPDVDDTVHCCPNCERPNQFGETCSECADFATGSESNA